MGLERKKYQYQRDHLVGRLTSAIVSSKPPFACEKLKITIILIHQQDAACGVSTGRGSTAGQLLHMR